MEPGMGYVSHRRGVVQMGMEQSECSVQEEAWNRFCDGTWL